MPNAKRKKKAAKPKNKSQLLVAEAFHEVHANTPSTVTRANVSGKQKDAMLTAIALNKARKAGARIPKQKAARKGD